MHPHHQSISHEANSEPDLPSPLESWKDAVRADFESWLASLDEIPIGDDDGDADLEAGAEPDLLSFYAELSALSAETRKANRRSAETFSQWGDVLTTFQQDLKRLRERLPAAATDAEKNTSSRSSAASTVPPRDLALALAGLRDRVARQGEAFDEMPKGRAGWFGNDEPWRRAWIARRESADMLLGHFDRVLEKLGLQRIPTEGQPFDPLCMSASESATSAEPGAQAPTVVEEIAPGWRMGDSVLRPAEVKVSV